MGCEAINAYLATDASRLGPWFYNKSGFATSPEMAFIPREEFPRGIGYDFRIFTAERAAPTSILSWTPVTALSADGEDANCGACAETFNLVDAGHTTRTATLYKYGLKSRMFCVEDLRTPWEVKQQLDALRNQLGKYVRLVWEQRAREDIFTFSQHKVVANGSLPGSFTSTMAAAYPAVTPTQVLTQETLEYWYAYLLREGAAEGALGQDNGPIIPLIIGPEASSALIRQSTNARNDLHYGEPKLLMKSVTASKIYRGFAHIITPFPRRFTLSGGVFTEVAPFSSQNKTVLTGAEQAAAYQNAPYEEATIPNKLLITHMVPSNISSPGGGTSFGPVSYTGDWIWKNIADQDGTNIFNTMGRFYGKIAVSPKPVHPEYGVSFVFRRCVPDIQALPTNCIYS